MPQLSEWVSQEFQNLAELLADYDHNLSLEMIPVAEWPNLIDRSKVFRVVDNKRNRVVLYADNVSSPQDILARVWSMDQTYHKVIKNIDAKNNAILALRMKRYQEEIDSQKDLSLFIFRNKKSRWHHEGRVKDEHFNDLGSMKKHIT